MEIILAKKSGFCFGVTRAAKLLEEQLTKKDHPVVTFGPLIHNDQFNEKMREKGAEIVNSVDEIKDKSVVITRAHGLEKSLILKLEQKDITLIDGVCPFVKLVHEKAIELEKYGYQVIIIGERDHPEVKAAASYVENSIILENSIEAEEIKKFKKIGVVVQTTQSQKNVEEVVKILNTKSDNIKLCNTRCSATEERQESAVELAKIVDIMVIVGGKHSGNTKRLYQLCSVIKPSFHIETADELNKEDFENINKVGITAGASTPQEIIDKVIEKLKTF